MRPAATLIKVAAQIECNTLTLSDVRTGMTKRIATYARVSTADQRTQAQLDALRKYARDRGAEAVEFVDHGVSGAKANRPALDQLLAAVRRREVGAVVVVKLDRLARSVRHLVTMAAEFEALGVDLVVLDQALDTGTPAGRLLFNVLGSIAEFERDLIRERVRAGQQAAKRRGVRFGRPEATDKATRERIMRLSRAGQTLGQIAALVDVPKSTVARVVARARAKGATGADPQQGEADAA